MATELVSEELAKQRARDLDSAAEQVRAALIELAEFSERRARAEAELKAEARQIKARNEDAAKRYEAARRVMPEPGEAPGYAAVLARKG